MLVDFLSLVSSKTQIKAFSLADPSFDLDGGRLTHIMHLIDFNSIDLLSEQEMEQFSIVRQACLSLLNNKSLEVIRLNQDLIDPLALIEAPHIKALYLENITKDQFRAFRGK